MFKNLKRNRRDHTNFPPNKVQRTDDTVSASAHCIDDCIIMSDEDPDICQSTVGGRRCHVDDCATSRNKQMETRRDVSSATEQSDAYDANHNNRNADQSIINTETDSEV